MHGLRSSAGACQHPALQDDSILLSGGAPRRSTAWGKRLRTSLPLLELRAAEQRRMKEASAITWPGPGRSLQWKSHRAWGPLRVRGASREYSAPRGWRRSPGGRRTLADNGNLRRVSLVPDVLPRKACFLHSCLNFRVAY
jgi:hypothetical protein